MSYQLYPSLSTTVDKAFAAFRAVCERKTAELQGAAAAASKQLVGLMDVRVGQELAKLDSDFAAMVGEVSCVYVGMMCLQNVIRLS